MKIVEMMKKFRKEEEGLSMVEYALVGSLIAVVAIVGFGQLGNAVNTKANVLAQNITTPG